MASQYDYQPAPNERVRFQASLKKLTKKGTNGKVISDPVNKPFFIVENSVKGEIRLVHCDSKGKEKFTVLNTTCKILERAPEFTSLKSLKFLIFLESPSSGIQVYQSSEQEYLYWYSWLRFFTRDHSLKSLTVVSVPEGQSKAISGPALLSYREGCIFIHDPISMSAVELHRVKTITTFGTKSSSVFFTLCYQCAKMRQTGSVQPVVKYVFTLEPEMAIPFVKWLKEAGEGTCGGCWKMNASLKEESFLVNHAKICEMDLTSTIRFDAHHLENSIAPLFSNSWLKLAKVAQFTESSIGNIRSQQHQKPAYQFLLSWLEGLSPETSSQPKELLALVEKAGMHSEALDLRSIYLEPGHATTAPRTASPTRRPTVSQEPVHESLGEYSLSGASSSSKEIPRNAALNYCMANPKPKPADSPQAPQPAARPLPAVPPLTRRSTMPDTRTSRSQSPSSSRHSSPGPSGATASTEYFEAGASSMAKSDCVPAAAPELPPTSPSPTLSPRRSTMAECSRDDTCHPLTKQALCDLAARIEGEGCGKWEVVARHLLKEGVANEILDTYPNAEPYKLLMFCLERWKKNQEGEVLCEPTAAVMVSLLERCGMPAIARWYQKAYPDMAYRTSDVLFIPPARQKPAGTMPLPSQSEPPLLPDSDYKTPRPALKPRPRHFSPDKTDTSNYKSPRPASISGGVPNPSLSTSADPPAYINRPPLPPPNREKALSPPRKPKPPTDKINKAVGDNNRPSPTGRDSPKLPPRSASQQSHGQQLQPPPPRIAQHKTEKPRSSSSPGLSVRECQAACQSVGLPFTDLSDKPSPPVPRHRSTTRQPQPRPLASPMAQDARAGASAALPTPVARPRRSELLHAGASSAQRTSSTTLPRDFMFSPTREEDTSGNKDPFSGGDIPTDSPYMNQPAINRVQEADDTRDINTSIPLPLPRRESRSFSDPKQYVNHDVRGQADDANHYTEFYRNP